uniref:Reverse transcriptase domain-containing protein n=1 Tax=Amphimedon queenslandica TaxID=400682 RepID=A0A1X7VT29_AMPQE
MAVTTPVGLFEFTHMSFGLRNAAQTFPRFMDMVLHGLEFAYIYIDDVLVATSDEVEHKKHCTQIFDRFKSMQSSLTLTNVSLVNHHYTFLGR